MSLEGPLLSVCSDQRIRLYPGQAVEDRLAVQRERVREMERNGELPMAQWEIEARAALAAQLDSEAPDG
jgi:hypothetical protein